MNETVTARVLAAVFALAALAACNVDRTTGERTVSGAGVGAAAGAVVGIFEGDFLESTAKGAATGAAAGFIYDQLRRW